MGWLSRQLRYDGRSVSLRTRNGCECSADFPELAELAGVPRKRRVTLDGELVCLRPDGRPDFLRLRRRLTGSRRRCPVILEVFDVLHLDGRSTRALPYRERRALLWRSTVLRGGRRRASWSMTQTSSFRASRISGWKASSPNASTRDMPPVSAQQPGSNTNFLATSNSRSPELAALTTAGFALALIALITGWTVRALVGTTERPN